MHQTIVSSYFLRFYYDRIHTWITRWYSSGILYSLCFQRGSMSITARMPTILFHSRTLSNAVEENTEQKDECLVFMLEKCCWMSGHRSKSKDMITVRQSCSFRTFDTHRLPCLIPCTCQRSIAIMCSPIVPPILHASSPMTTVDLTIGWLVARSSIVIFIDWWTSIELFRRWPPAGLNRLSTSIRHWSNSSAVPKHRYFNTMNIIIISGSLMIRPYPV